MRRLPISVTVLTALGAAFALAGFRQVWPQGARHDAHWQEIAWPYPRDGWPAGRAFRCDGCAGGQLELYVRPKLGFCNCETGVADDDEVDRVADLDLISQRFAPLKPGKVIQVADLSGRARTYNLEMADGARHRAIGIAVSHRCDLLVAVLQGKMRADELERAALRFLTTSKMKQWVSDALGGG
jgi:hypothetical protein